MNNEYQIECKPWEIEAIRAGRKTTFIRAIEPQPEPLPCGWWFYDGETYTDETLRSHLFHNVYGGSDFPYGGVYADDTADRLILAGGIVLEVMDVKPVRLWEMAFYDMLADGVEELPEDSDKHPLTPFVEVWDADNPAHPWQSNPWVWRVEFRVVETILA